MTCFAPSCDAIFSFSSEEEVAITVAPEATASWRANLDENENQQPLSADYGTGLHGHTTSPEDKNIIACLQRNRAH
jgi:hypothetical protein